MADTKALEIDQLAANVQGLSLDALAESYPTSQPRDNLLDLWRAHISNVLSDISGVEKDIIYRAISWTSVLDKGDFVIPIPALRVKGAKPDALATEWASKVDKTLTRAASTHDGSVNKSLPSGPRTILLFKRPRPMVNSSASSSSLNP